MALLQRVARGHILLDQCAVEMFGFVFGALPCLPRFCGGAAGVLRIAKIVCAELFAQRGFLGIERGEGFLGLALAAREQRARRARAPAR